MGNGNSGGRGVSCDQRIKGGIVGKHAVVIDVGADSVEEFVREV